MLSLKEVEIEVCPICAKAFRRTDIEAHVNECLDGGGAAGAGAKAAPVSHNPKAPEYKPPDKPLNLDKLLSNIHQPPKIVPPAPAPQESKIIDLTAFSSVPANANSSDNPMATSHFLDELTGNVKPGEVKVKLPDIDDLLKPTPSSPPLTKPTTEPNVQRHKILLSNDDDDHNSKFAKVIIDVDALPENTNKSNSSASPTPCPAAQPKPPAATTTPTNSANNLENKESDNAKGLGSTLHRPMGDDEIQAAALALFKKKKEQEEQDRLMALQLAEELDRAEREREEERQKQRTLRLLAEQEKEKQLRAQNEAEQLRVAMMFQQEEENLRKAELARKAAEDERLARSIFENEKADDDRKKEQRDWEETMALIKEQAKAEMDAQLARLMKEKEDLEASLHAMRVNHSDVNESTISLAGVEYPKYWQPQKANFQSFEVPPHTAEYDRVISEFRRSAHVNVKSLWRNQNRSLWMWFYLKKKEIAAKNGGKDNEQYLFHGSRSNAYETILADGFDHRVANMGGAIGAGVYFATQASTSMGYVGNAGTRKMLVCRVLLGEVGPGQAGLRRPPPRSRGKGLCDSVGSPGMFVIFDNYQAYPEYTVVFA